MFAVSLSFCGTFFVYNVDRIRDIERDRATTPARTRFIEGRRAQLGFLSGLAALASLGSAAMLPARVTLLCAAVLSLGLFHRRIKHIAGLKTAYITFAWTAVCVGIPALLGGHSLRESLPVGVAIGMPIAANLIVSNLRDREGGVALVSHRSAIGLALALCLSAAAACAVEAFGVARGLAALPVLEAMAIASFNSPAALRDRERYSLAVVDGALLVGALLARLLLEARWLR